ncbi:hypothetical protein NL676_016692 [Syzygium grande]|nr:hypothetical protein NL676_016692 [Syzygium grande]
MERYLLLRSFGTASDLSRHAVGAYLEEDYEIAVELFTRAISLSPKDAQLFTNRAQAHLMLGNFTEAVADASRAIELDPSMSKAYFRLGNAFYELKKYQTAKATLELGSSLAPADAKITDLIKRCDEDIAETYGEILNPPLGKASTQVVPVEGGQESGQIVNEVPNQATSNLNVKSKYRHQFYQEPEEVVVTILAKGIPPQHVAVHFGEQSLSVIIRVPGEDAYHFQPSLFGKIAPDSFGHWISEAPYSTLKRKRVDCDELEAQVKKEEKEESDALTISAKMESKETVLSKNWKEGVEEG